MENVVVSDKQVYNFKNYGRVGLHPNREVFSTLVDIN